MGVARPSISKRGYLHEFFVTFEVARPTVGVLVEGHVADATEALRPVLTALPACSPCWSTNAALPVLEALEERGRRRCVATALLADLRLLAPLAAGELYCAFANYGPHVEISGTPADKTQEDPPSSRRR
jgi:hypothetical protein